MTELIWEGKYDKEGHKVAPLRVRLPFQTVETVNESAQIWCENATLLTGTAWEYIKVPQKEFEKLEATQFSDLLFFVISNW